MGTRQPKQEILPFLEAPPGRETSLYSTELIEEAVLNQPRVMAVYRREMEVVTQKIITLVEFHVQNTQADHRGYYTLPKQVVREFIGWDQSNNYTKAINDSFLELHRRLIQWNCLNADPDYELITLNFVISTITPSQRGSFIKFQLHPDVEKIIKSPGTHSKVRLLVAPILHRQHSFALFELLMNAQSQSNEWEVDISDLRYLLAIQDGQYSEFKYFRRDVLDASVKEINEKTELFVEYSKVREGKKITRLRFKVGQQPWHAREDLLKKKHLLHYLEKTTGFSPERLTIKLHRESLMDMGLSEKEAQRALMEYGFDRLKKNIQAANDYIVKKGNKITSRNAVYIKSIENDWSPEPVIEPVKAISRKGKAAQMTEQTFEMDIDTAYQLFDKRYQGEGRSLMESHFERYISSNWTVGASFYREQGLTHKDVKPYFVKWLLEIPRVRDEFEKIVKVIPKKG